MFLNPYAKVPALVWLVLALAPLVMPSMAIALDDDREKPIHVKADSAERDDRKGMTTYRGDVVIDQGSLNIIAQEVITFGSSSIDKVVATGRPARLRQRPEPDKGYITAKGDKLEYSMETEVVILQSNAYLEQDGSKIRGDKITYDLNKRVVRATGSASDDGRVEIVIPPPPPKDKPAQQQ